MENNMPPSPLLPSLGSDFCTSPRNDPLLSPSSAIVGDGPPSPHRLSTTSVSDKGSPFGISASLAEPTSSETHHPYRATGHPLWAFIEAEEAIAESSQLTAGVVDDLFLNDWLQITRTTHEIAPAESLSALRIGLVNNYILPIQSGLSNLIGRLSRGDGNSRPPLGEAEKRRDQGVSPAQQDHTAHLEEVEREISGFYALHAEVVEVQILIRSGKEALRQTLEAAIAEVRKLQEVVSDFDRLEAQLVEVVMCGSERRCEM